MKTLKFLGIEAGFGLNNTSAYAIENNNLILIDCGGTVFSKLYKMDLNNGFLKNRDKIEIIITHLHDDHVGSLGSLLLYCKYILNKKPIIHTKCKNIKELLSINGVVEDLYEMEESKNIEFIETEHTDLLDSYGFILKINGKKIIYTGDAANFDPFLSKMDNVSEIYIDTNTRKSLVHINLIEQLDFLKALERKGPDIYLMHTDDIDMTKELIKGTNLHLAMKIN